jgi:photosystem II stability/assembly factor-like uncharacterized protein
VDWLAGQGWYDNTIAAHPFDADRIFVGGINLWQMEVVPGLDSSEAVPTGVDLVNTDSFLSFVDFGGELAGGGIAIGPAGIGEFTTVEMRFGAGRRQMAHRFTVPSGATSGVPDSDYTYRDYVEVPFEFWDLDNNRQLMVSFRDQTENGQWELQKFDSNTAREYVFLHSVPYAESPSGDIAQTAGQISRQLYFLWPILPETAVWDPDNLPESTLRINFGRVISKRMTVSNVTDGYGQFGGSPKGVHVDHHNILLTPTSEVDESFRLLNANDGGVSFSDNAGLTFRQPLNGYNTTQFYGVDKKNGAHQYIGGMQDNSTWISPGGGNPDAVSQWFLVLGGDGFECVWNYGDSRKLLASAQFNSIFRSLNDGVSWGNVNTASGLTDVGGRAPFFTKLAKSKQDPDLIFAVGSSGVWRSDNFADSWDLVAMPVAWAGNRSFTEVKISLANPQIVWAAEAMQEDVRPFVSVDSGLSFTETNAYSEAMFGAISGLETHPTDERTAYMLFSFAKGPKILRTTDLGQTWEDISGFGNNEISSSGVPDVAVHGWLVMPFDADKIWAGTEIGLFESTDGGASWAFADNGLPNTAIFEMLIVNDEIVVATHGRGVWTISLPELAGYEPNAATLSPRLNHAEAAGAGAVRVGVSLRSAYDSTLVLVDRVRQLRLTENDAAVDTTVNVPLGSGSSDTASVMIASFKAGNEFKSFSKRTAVVPLVQAQASYVTDFNAGADDFNLVGFDVQPSNEFVDPAIHSDHPYPNNSNLIMTLKIPIIVASESAVLSYDDVALVEAGETGSRFGGQNFWDFVVVEGSDDLGLSWLPLADGYDARYDQAWLDTYRNDGVVSSALFRSHTVNLLDKFEAGEQILIRFRLFSDTSVNGWGWVIDNLDIQRAVTSVAEEALVPESFSLSQNFPNPFNPTTDIVYTLPQSEHVTLRIFNVAGQEIRTLVREQQNTGVYRVRWDGKDDSGRSVASGLYFYRIKAGSYVASRKMTLIK